MSYWLLLGIIILFIMGCYYQMTKNAIEDFKDYETNNQKKKVVNKKSSKITNPYILIYQDKLYWLINTKKSMEPDVNPKVFSKIDDYKKYSRSNGLPVTKVTKKSTVPKFMADMTIHNKDKDIKFKGAGVIKIDLQRKHMPLVRTNMTMWRLRKKKKQV